MRRKALVALGTAVLAMAFASPAMAERLVVDNDFADCPDAVTNSIEAGVELANPGDTVFVCRGVYTEQVTIESDDSNIRVVGQDRDDTILDGLNLPAMQKGFHLIGTSNVLITRFTVQRYHDDIWLTNSDENTISDNETRLAFGHDGIVVTDGSDGNLVEFNISHDNLHPTSCGISVGGGASFNIVRKNETLRNPNQGILLGGALLGVAGPGNRIEHNYSHDNGLPFQGANRGVGILNNAPQTVIAHNLVADNRAHGILSTGAVSSGVVVEHNTVLRNGSLNDDDGIRLQNGASNSVVSHNLSSGNRHDGVHLTATTGQPGANNNVVEYNHLVHNGTQGVGNGCGVDADNGSANNTLRHNHAEAHDMAGIRIRNAGTGNVVARNDVSDNGRNGILNDNTIGTLIEGNHASRNVGFGGPNGVGIRIMNSSAAAAPITVEDNHTDANSENGIAVGNSRDVTVAHNHSNRNALDGIRSGPTSSGNLFVENHMLRNAEHDAHDENRPANTWTGNHCKTDFPSGTIC
jgi:parallel beta-helix repeat protein